MKKSILPLVLPIIILVMGTSCQRNLNAYQGDLFLPQEFTTACMENLSDRSFAVESDRTFNLKANGDLIRKNPDGSTYFFKITSSISMFSDDEEGFSILWTARDLNTDKELTIYLYQTSLQMVYDNGEACQYRMSCTPKSEVDQIQLQALSLR